MNDITITDTEDNTILSSPYNEEAVKRAYLAGQASNKRTV